MPNQTQRVPQERDLTLTDLRACGIGACRVKGGIWVGEHARIAFASTHTNILMSLTCAGGFGVGYATCLAELEQDQEVVLTDQELTERIERALPVSLSPDEQREWRKGYVFGWTMAWFEAAMIPTLPRCQMVEFRESIAGVQAS
ncbi:MAG TPA: hypothetical protein VFA10_16735 [Ktedonobacteraceae bacterium]|nr:hypothetical protein [Ktedonobacteraceae bacterium]